MMANLFLFLKGLHVIGFVSWFAGMFYLARIFVYYTEARQRPQAERDILTREFGAMQKRVYKIICNPAMMLTWIAGLGMLTLGYFHPSVPNYLSGGHGTDAWMHLKLFLVILLSAYQGWCGHIIKQLEKGEQPFTSFQFRLFNEIPTLFLAAIAFIAVYGKTGQLNYLYVFGGVALFGLLVYRGAVAYRKHRESME